MFPNVIVHLIKRYHGRSDAISIELQTTKRIGRHY